MLQQSEYNTNQTPLQISQLNFRRSGISTRKDLSLLKKELNCRSNVDFQQLIQNHSSAIEAVNQREALLLEREQALRQRLEQHDCAVDTFRMRVVKLQNEEAKLKLRKQALDEEWAKVDAQKR